MLPWICLDLITCIACVHSMKNLPTMQEMRNAGDAIQSLGWEDTLEKEMATHSSILAWKIPQTKEPGML